MANTYRVTHCFQGQAGTSLDMYCNQFYFYAAAHVPADVETWGPLLANYVHQLFVVTPSTISISNWYSGRCLGNLGSTKIYDVTGNPATAGPPIFVIADEVLVPSEDYLADAPDNVDPLPEEVALCLSYQAIHTDGNLPRRRGRIYLGPFNQNAVNDGDFFGQCRPAAGLRNAMVEGAVEVQAAAAANDFEWRVFSTMDGFAFKIVNFSVDNAFDTIRGRGTAPNDRLTLPIS